MNNAMFKKLKRKPKWKLKEEKQELLEQQKRIRIETETLKDNLTSLQADMIAALQANDGTSIAVIQNQIDTINEKIEKNDKRYKANGEVLEIYSKIVKNDKEGTASKVGAVCGAIAGFGGLLMGYVGLSGAYRADEEGSLVNKNTLGWVSKMPIFKIFGGGKH